MTRVRGYSATGAIRITDRMDTQIPRHDIVLLGLGHTNAHILRMWRMKPLPRCRLTCVSDHGVATYSGMLPGVLAGQYPESRMEIDLVRLCAAAGARLIVDRVSGLDPAGRELLFESRPPLPFDALSIGVGSVPNTTTIAAEGGSAITIKPMQTFLQRLDQRLAALAAQPVDRPLRIAVIGGGIGGVEIAFCLPGRLRRHDPELRCEVTLVTAHDRIDSGVTARTSRTVLAQLQRRGVRLELGRRVTRVDESSVHFESGGSLDVDLSLLATSAVAPPLLESFDLPKDERGFLETDGTLRTTRADCPVFVVGDSGTNVDEPTRKAGVFAVRQGPVLWENLRRHVSGQPLHRYKPQRNFLKLINTGDGKAIAEYAGLTLSGRWCWWLKDAIDGRFMDKYQDYRPMEMSNGGANDSESPAMRCTGCGGKVAGSVLSRVLAGLDIPAHPMVEVGLDQPDDAAILRVQQGSLVATVDFFAAPLDDAYLTGRLAALNALSDVHAMGAKPQAALAMIQTPVGAPHKQEQMLRELLSGGLLELRRSGATLVGGHTIEGPRLTAGFTVLADSAPSARTKGRLRSGDRLLLTKPLGTGVLLAAHMAAQCRAEWFERLLAHMLRDPRPALRFLTPLDIAAMTDVTGFGLAGHLREMLVASDRCAEISLGELPLLDGFAELAAAGIESTLAPANRAVEAFIDAEPQCQSSERWGALFDPQTCGGLLVGIPEYLADGPWAAELADRLPDARLIGKVIDGDGGRIRVVP